MNYVGKYIKVTQEVFLDGEWSPIEYEGWVAKHTDSEVAFDNGDTYGLEGDGIRGTAVSVVEVIKSRPAWLIHPDRWEKKWLTVRLGGREDEGDFYYEPDLSPKVPDADCYRCSLFDAPIAMALDRTNQADVLHVAEAPGREEVNEQDFMVGRSGTLYRSLLKQIFGKYTSTINNACMCYGETPDGRAIEACKARLNREIATAKPRLIMAVGGVALKALTGLDGITEHQCLILPPESADNPYPVPIIPCFHPAALLRRPDMFPDLVNALSKARLFLDGEGLINVQPDSFDKQLATKYDYRQWLAKLQSYPRVYCDLETDGLSPWKDKILCVSLAAGDDTGVKLGVVFPWDVVYEGGEVGGNFIDRVVPELKELLEKRCVGYFNGPFDCQFLRSAGVQASVGSDVMLKQYTLDERPTAQGLKYIGRRYCSAPDWEAPLKPYAPYRTSSYADVPKDILYLYASLDGCYTGTLDPLMDKLMTEDNKRVYGDILLPAENMLLDVCRVGIPVDTTRLKELGPELVKRIGELQAELIVIAGREFNPGSTKQTREVMWDLFKYDGSTGRQVLEEHFSGEEFVDKLLDFRTTRKLLGTYVEGILDDIVDGRIHPNLRLNGTVTGRLSAGEPNMLGIPKEKGGIKKMFVADPGYLLMEADGSQMEIRVLGALANDPQMILDFRTGVDFHGQARNRLYGKGLSKASYTHQEVLDAKTGVFGPIYGRGAPSMARLLKCSIPEAQAYIDKLWAPYPVSLAYLKGKEKEVHITGELKSYYGRIRRWGLITEDNVKNVEHEARNFTVSSASSDTNLLVMLETYRTYPRDVVLPLLPVHDSILCRVRKDGAEEIAREYRKFCQKTAQRLLNSEMFFDYEVSLGPSWGEQEIVE